MNKMNFQWLKRIKTLFWSDMDGMDEVDHIQMSCQKHGKSSSFVMMNSECSQCDDFQTFDWPRELEKDRHRHRNLYLQQHTHLSQILDALSAWICVFIVAFLCGVIAAMVDIGTGWMSDLKEGICPEKFWLNKEHCCWSANDSFFEEDQCNNWQTWAYKLGYKSERDYLSAYFVEGAIFISFSLLFATLAVLLLRTFAPYAVGGGIPELKTVLSGYIIKGLLGKWTLIIKAIGVILAVAAGLVLGKEGPLVHVACCIGNIIAYLFPKYGNNEAKKREILSAAAAAGVSVAFGAPIGGVLFSLEEVSYYFPLKTLWRTFFCALIASFTLTSINPFGNNHMIVFYIDYTTPWVFIELIPFALLGIIGGFLGSLFIKANIYMCKLRKTTALGKFPVTEVIVVTLITALFNFPLEYTRLDLSHLIAQLVRRCDYGDKIDLCDYKYKLGTNDEFVRIGMGDGITRAMWQLAVTFIIKFSLLIITVGMKMPAGLYIPSLAIGAIVGRMVGTAMEQLFMHVLLYPYVSIFKGECTTECITPGLYAMVGAAAMLGGVTRMTVGLVVIIFEVTGGVKYIVPIMTAVMFSKWVGDAVSKKGIFEALIILNDYPFLDIKDEFNYATVTKEVMNPKNNEPLVVLTQDGMTIKEIETLLNDYSFNGFPVVVSRQSQYLVGFVLRKDLFLELRKVKKEHGNLPNTEILFTDGLCQAANDNVAAVNSQLDFSHIVDLATVTISKQTPMETVVDMFKKIGFRQLLVTHRGYLQGIITKKDVVRHIKQQETLNH